MPLTYFFAEFMGLFCLVVGLAVLTRPKMLVEVVKDIEDNRAILFILGILSLFLGLLVVLMHDIWNEGLLSFVVTLIGWLMILRGIFALFVSHHDLVHFVRKAKFEKYSWVYGLLVFILGLLLTYAALLGN